LRSRTWRRTAGIGVTAAGVVAFSAGLWMTLIWLYNVLRVLGEADRSWLFWGLAILFGGIILVRLGVRLVVFGRQMTRSERDDGSGRNQGGR
jgi:hypothetical protein